MRITSAAWSVIDTVTLPVVAMLEPAAMLNSPVPASTVTLPEPELTSELAVDRSTPVPERFTAVLVEDTACATVSEPPAPEAVRLTPPGAVTPLTVPISSVRLVTVSGLVAALLVIPGPDAASWWVGVYVRDR